MNDYQAKEGFTAVSYILMSKTDLPDIFNNDDKRQASYLYKRKLVVMTSVSVLYN